MTVVVYKRIASLTALSLSVLLFYSAAFAEYEGTTETPLDNIIGTIQADEKVQKKLRKGRITQDQLDESLVAIDDMNLAILEALDTIGAFDNRYVSAQEIIDANGYLTENYGESWSTIISSVNSYGAKEEIAGTKVRRIVYHLSNIGFEFIHKKKTRGRFYDKYGRLRTRPIKVSYFLNNLLYPKLVPHDFFMHAMHLLGMEALAPNQERFGGYEWVSENKIVGISPITGLRPVIEQAIDQVLDNKPDLEGENLERMVANQLTNLNDWNQLWKSTKNNLMILTGVNFQAMIKRERELTINHLLHSPLPFGNIDKPLTPDVVINLGYTHTLDKNKTTVMDLGDGLFRVYIISNNNDGSHTGHNLGSFVVQLEPGVSIEKVKAIGNSMVKNQNNNNKLYLSEAAKDILYGDVPRLDFEMLTDEEKESLDSL